MNAETIKLVPKHLATYKVFGEPDGPHYAHYDIVGGRLVCNLSSFFFFRELKEKININFYYIIWEVTKSCCVQISDIFTDANLQAPQQLFPSIIEFLADHDSI